MEAKKKEQDTMENDGGQDHVASVKMVRQMNSFLKTAYTICWLAGHGRIENSYLLHKQIGGC